MIKKIIIETDLGNDPDDLWAILYLLAAGVDIKAITIAPGDPYQIAIANFLKDFFSLNYKVGSVNKIDKNYSIPDYYKSFINLFVDNYQSDYKDCKYGPDLISKVLKENKDVDLFIIGPLINVGICSYFTKEDEDIFLTKKFMQGGSYNSFNSSYNFDNSMANAGNFAYSFLDICGKSNCRLNDFFIGKPATRSTFLNYGRLVELEGSCLKNRFHEVLHMSLMKYCTPKSGNKSISDLIAAVAYVHPDIVDWKKGFFFKDTTRGWNTIDSEDGYNIASAIDIDKFWYYIRNINDV